MSTDHEEQKMNINEDQEEALTEPEAPGQVLDPLVGPVGTRGIRRTVMSEFDEEDARERPPEDGLNPEIPEDENLQISEPQNWEDELDDQ